MKLGIDIDDTIADTTKVVLEYTEKQGIFRLSDEKVFEKCKEMLRGVDLSDESKEFYKNNLKTIISNTEPKPQAVETLKKLKEEGNEIFLITARTDAYVSGIHDLTLEWLKAHDITFDKLIFDAKEKVDVCKENQIDVMIDDSVKTCENLKNNGVNAIVMNSYFNKEDSTSLKRVNNWEDIKMFFKV